MKCLILLGVMMAIVAIQCGYIKHLHNHSDVAADDNENEETEKHGHQGHTDCGFPDPDNDCIPGIAGVNYDNLVYPPENTAFQCGPPLQPGFYSDPAYKCQVYYICDENNGKYTFTCAIGLVFDQQELRCVLWTEYDCSTAQSHYDDPQHGVFPPSCHHNKFNAASEGPTTEKALPEPTTEKALPEPTTEKALPEPTEDIVLPVLNEDIALPVHTEDKSLPEPYADPVVKVLAQTVAKAQPLANFHNDDPAPNAYY